MMLPRSSRSGRTDNETGTVMPSLRWTSVSRWSTVSPLNTVSYTSATWARRWSGNNDEIGRPTISASR